MLSKYANIPGEGSIDKELHLTFVVLDHCPQLQSLDLTVGSGVHIKEGKSKNSLFRYDGCLESNSNMG